VIALTIGFIIVVTAAGLAGGAVSGITLAAKDLGHELAALMGAFYGLTVALPTALVAGAYLVLAGH
jgi:hypothetical protein